LFRLFSKKPPAEGQPLDVRAIHDAHADFVWRSLQRLGVRASDLEDVFQEVFVVVHRRLGSFDGSSSMTTWLYGICFRVAAGHRRRAWVRREQPSDEVPEPDDARASTPADEAIEAREARATLDRVLDQMDLERRAVFVMAEIDELPHDEIAAVIGVPVGTVWSRLSAARKEFQAILARERAARASRGPWA
jgi:RNA polymerase sigma-70 factor (ECF subfamily)